MKDKGYFGIGILHGKTPINYGTLCRTAQILNADFIFMIGAKFKVQASDTMNSSKHLPLFEYKDFADFNEHRPYGCQLVGIEIDPKSVPLHSFKHPKSACYLLGAEDNGLTKEATLACQHLVYLPGDRSMNVSVAGSIVIYDRVIKSDLTPNTK